MALLPRLELRQAQGLVMTPQLMQAIKLLQMSNLDLAAYVEAELEQNPLLEQAGDETDSDGPADREAASEDTPPRQNGPDDLVTAARDGSLETISEKLDADYGNVFEADGSPGSPPPTPDGADSGWSATRGDRRAADGSGDFLEATVADTRTLHEHLVEQLHIAVAEPRARIIGRHLIDLIDGSGYLRDDLATIAERLGALQGELEAVLGVIQTFDPTGVGARNLSECLSIQLREQDRLDPAMQLFIANLDLLARREMALLKATCGVDDEDLADMIAEIRRLDPKPGNAFGDEPVQPVVPDVFVRPGPDGGWQIELNADTLPRVLLDQTYYSTVARGARSDSERAYLSDCLQKANWLVRSLDQRARTILKVSSEIVRQQDAFMARGVRHLRPLNLRNVADAIEMHESTVSRVTANKYMSTPRGIFELKYFFTTSIAATEGGEGHSAEAVRHRIRELIGAEAPDGVLSDDALVAILRGDGIDIARRTVAKYRESLRIASSVQRRREKRVTA